MALTPTVLFDCYITINANVVSDHANKAEIPFTLADLKTTAFGQTWENRTGGLKDAALNLDFYNDFTASQLDSIVFPLYTAGVPVPFEIRPTSAARSATNPAYTGNVLILDWKPIVGKVGDLVVASVSWKTSGPVQRLIV